MRRRHGGVTPHTDDQDPDEKLDAGPQGKGNQVLVSEFTLLLRHCYDVLKVNDSDL